LKKETNVEVEVHDLLLRPPSATQRQIKFRGTELSSAPATGSLAGFHSLSLLVVLHLPPFTRASSI